ncbi:MAG: deaminase [Chloroflexi bacterium 13_1_40CM_4_68_4]|nr:MAG: deaminase [Chloroflexi bacterium 13_1_40CM_4_68_4]
MRQIIYSMMVSLDGFIETAQHRLDWIIIDEELHTFANEQARDMGTFLYGRRLYELMAAYWPTADANPSTPPYMAEFARIWRDKPKVVFSKTLAKVEWNSRLVRDNITEVITKLKQEPGRDMSIGGPNIASTFMRLGFVDEYRLLVNLDRRISLRLVEKQTFGAGVVYLRYEEQRRTSSP